MKRKYKIKNIKEFIKGRTKYSVNVLSKRKSGMEIDGKNSPQGDEVNTTILGSIHKVTRLHNDR